MPRGVYKHKSLSKEHKQNIFLGYKKYLAQMTKEEKKEYYKPWTQAGVKATIAKFAKMTKKERREYMDKCQKAGVKASQTLKARRKNSESSKKYWATIIKEKRREHMLPALKASQEANPSSIEKKIWKELNKLGIKYETQAHFDRFVVDIYISIWRLIVECNGTYWHNLPQRKERDRKLKIYAKNNNYKLIELSEYEIKKNPKQALLEGLKVMGIFNSNTS